MLIVVHADPAVLVHTQTKAALERYSFNLAQKRREPFLRKHKYSSVPAVPLVSHTFETQEEDGNVVCQP